MPILKRAHGEVSFTACLGACAIKRVLPVNVGDDGPHSLGVLVVGEQHTGVLHHLGWTRETEQNNNINKMCK
jgi:hypothetical protein